MIRNYILSAIRGFTKNKSFTIINVLGLSLSIAAVIVIVLFARNELTYDMHNSKAKNIYLVYKERITPNGVQPTYDTWVPLKNELLNQYPEVVNAARFFQDNEAITVNENRFDEDVYYADPEYFQIFDFPLAEGDNDNPLPDNLSVVISKSMATKFFGKSDPIGKDITVNYQTNYKVTGVLKDYPSNTTIRSDIILPIQGHPDYKQVEKEWGSSFLLTYILLDPKANPASLEAKFPALIKNIWNNEVESRTKFKLLPLKDHYDVFVGDSQDSYMLLYIALGIIIIAGINFMNLSTARSMDRAKEIGMRKVIGAGYLQLIIQFLSEAILLSLMGTVIGVLIAAGVLPFVNASFGMNLSIPYSNSVAVFSLVGFSLILGLFSGSYPAFYLARIKILSSLKGGSISGKSGGTIRNSLVLLQFTISLVLIIGTMIIASQVRFMKNSNLAFKKDNLMVVPLRASDFEDSEEAIPRMETFKNEIAKYSAVKMISASRHVPGRWSQSYLFARPEGWEGNPMRMRYTYIDANFFQTYGIDLLDGTGFLPDENGDQRQSAVINEAAMKAFGWTDIKDKTVMVGNRQIQVVGLVRDFNFETLRQKIDPILFFHRVSSNPVHAYITIKMVPGNENQVKDFVADKWKILNSDKEFSYFYIDDEMKTLYAGEDRLLKAVQGFTLLSIVISCLGLFGLTSFIISRRRKEIGIRKVLGAKILGLSLGFSKSYLKLILLSFIVAGPVSYFLMKQWLEQFAYKTEQNILIYLGSLLILFLMAGLTVSAKTINAARANPVKSLREE